MQHNLKLIVENCEIRSSELTNGGHRFTDSSLKPDPAKIQAVQEMNRSKNNLTELHCLIFSEVYAQSITGWQYIT